VIGWLTVQPVLFGGFFGGAIHVEESHDVLKELALEFHDPLTFLGHAFESPVSWLAAAGFVAAWLFFLKKPEWADMAAKVFKAPRFVLENKYGFDWFNENVLAAGTRLVGGSLWRAGDQGLIDGLIVNGSARTVAWLSSVMRYAQSGYLYHYAFAMIMGLAALLAWLLWRGAVV
jgi:NADH-quinone oxidoreductase subunit L